MPARPGPKKPPKPVGDLSDPRGFGARFELYVEWMQVRSYAEATVRTRRRQFGYFVKWCEERGLTRPEEITRPILERHARYLYLYRNAKTGRPLSVLSQHSRLRAIRGFFRFLTRKNYLLSNPASELDMPRLPNQTPKNVLTVDEAEAVLSQPDVNTLIGIRDRAIIETFYSTGIRRSELIRLRLVDVNDGQGVVSVVQGKGRKDRAVPIGERALDWIERYRWEVRSRWAPLDDDGTLFLTQYGESMSPDHTTEMVRRYVLQANIGKKGSCHIFRHTMATLMLEGGADVRLIQEMLGHTNLTTTQIYTRVSIRHLKKIHEASHPSAKRKRSRNIDE